MATKQDYYDILGVPRSASQEEIKRAFRRLAMQYHPDRNREDGAEGRFKGINEAYEVLSDPERRAAYDRFGHAGLESSFGRGFEGFGFGGFGDIFDAFFGGTGVRRRGPQRGADVHRSITLKFEEAAFGCEKKIEVKREEICSACNGLRAEPGTEPERCTSCDGTGEVRRTQRTIFGQFVNVATCSRCGGEGRVVRDPCRRCGGSGREERTRSIEVKIPAGIDSGSQLRLSGEGDMGHYGGPRGNLYISVNVRPHKLFRRDDDDIVLDLELNFAQAALGDELEIPTLDGPLNVKIPAGTQSGEVFVMRGKGVPHLRSSGRGDLLVRAHVATPKSLTPEQRRLFEQLAESLNSSVTSQDDKGLINRIKDALS
jgi:molecular chaperone DnaJ